MNATYARRRAAGVCPLCCGTPRPGRIYCGPCTARIVAARGHSVPGPGRAPRFHVRTPGHARRIEARGRRLTIREWSIETGLSEWTIRDRLRRGWPAWKAVTVRVRREERPAA